MNTKKLLRTLKYIWKHPYNRDRPLAGVARFLSWQVRCRLTSKTIDYRFTENSILRVKKGMTGATGNLYCGLMEYPDMTFLLHFLRPNDHFADIGANVGVYSVLASAEIGAYSHVFEPVPATYKLMLDNIKVNGLEERTLLHRVGVGSAKGSIRFTTALDTVNHVAMEDDVDTIEVPVLTADELLVSHPIALVKIDVEGYESEVVKGASELLSSPNLKAIIIELNGSGERYGFDDNKIHEALLSYGFLPHTYKPTQRVLVPLESYGTHNTIYIRDFDFVHNRVKSARSVKVGHKKV